MPNCRKRSGNGFQLCSIVYQSQRRWRNRRAGRGIHRISNSHHSGTYLRATSLQKLWPGNRFGLAVAGALLLSLLPVEAEATVPDSVAIGSSPSTTALKQEWLEGGRNSGFTTGLAPNTSDPGGGQPSPPPGIKIPDLRTIGALLAASSFDAKLSQCLMGNNDECIQSTLELLGVTLPQSQGELVQTLLRENLVAQCGIGIIAALPTLGGPTVAECLPLGIQEFTEALAPQIVY